LSEDAVYMNIGEEQPCHEITKVYPREFKRAELFCEIAAHSANL